MNSSNSFSLEEYKIQRQYREEKRKNFLNQFQLFRQKLGLSQRQVTKSALNNENKNAAPIKDKNVKIGGQQQELVLQNNKLKQKLSELEMEEREKLNKFKQQISGAKQQYIDKVKEISEIANAQKIQAQAKISKMEQQIKAATLKNQEIEQYNKKVEQQCKKANQIMEKYSSEVQKQYDQKLQEFSSVFNSSNQKIKNLEQQYNQQQFINATLENQQLINSIKQNADKADQQIEKIVSDYKQLLSGKTEIFESLSQNNKMKEEEIQKMSMLQEKMKTIFEKINEEKKIYLDENKKMAEELIEVKELLTKAMGG